MALQLSDASWRVRSGVLRVWRALPTVTSAMLVAVTTALRTYLATWSTEEVRHAMQVGPVARDAVRAPRVPGVAVAVLFDYCVVVIVARCLC